MMSGSDSTSCLEFLLHEMELTPTSQVVIGTEQDTNVWESTQQSVCHMMESQKKAQAEMTLKKKSSPCPTLCPSHWESWGGKWGSTGMKTLQLLPS